MTLVVFLTIATSVIALVEIGVFTRMRNAGKVGEAVYPILIIATASLPVIIYLAFTYFVPETGAIELF